MARSDRVKLLGFAILGDTIAVAYKALQRAMDKVKALTRRGTHLRLEDSIERINSWYVGWVSYFALTNYPAQLRKTETHVWRRLRSRLVDQQNNQRNLTRKSIARGVPRRQAATTVYSNRGRWALSNTRAVTKAYPNDWFTAFMGQAIGSDRQLRHWFDVERWIRLA